MFCAKRIAALFFRSYRQDIFVFTDRTSLPLMPKLLQSDLPLAPQASGPASVSFWRLQHS